MQNAQPTTHCATRILKVDYLSISKQQKKFGVSKMQGSGTGDLTMNFKSVIIIYDNEQHMFLYVTDNDDGYGKELAETQLNGTIDIFPTGCSK